MINKQKYSEKEVQEIIGLFGEYNKIDLINLRKFPEGKYYEGDYKRIAALFSGQKIFSLLWGSPWNFRDNSKRDGQARGSFFLKK